MRQILDIAAYVSLASVALSGAIVAVLAIADRVHERRRTREAGVIPLDAHRQREARVIPFPATASPDDTLAWEDLQQDYWGLDPEVRA